MISFVSFYLLTVAFSMAGMLIVQYVENKRTDFFDWIVIFCFSVIPLINIVSLCASIICIDKRKILNRIKK